jgi:hypothetical protein
MKRQQKFRAPAGYKLLNELDRNRRATGTIERKPKYDLSQEANPFFNIAYTGGRIGADGFYVANLNGSPIRFPVKAGGGTLNFDTTNTASPFGPISGTSFVSSDSTFLYSNNTETSFTDERSFVFGGIPVNSSFYAPTANTRVLAFAVQPDAALQANVPFIRSNAGGNLPNASISPYYIVARPNQ